MKIGVGSVLKNGATVIRHASHVDGDIVLCKWRNDYVTWRIDGEGNAYWGNYRHHREDAEKDFDRRAQG